MPDVDAGYLLLFDAGREWPSLWGLALVVWFGMIGGILWLSAADNSGWSRGPKSPEARKLLAALITLGGVGMGLVMTGASLVEWLKVRHAIRTGAGAMQEGPVHGFDSTPRRGHEPRFGVGPVRFEVPFSLSQTAVRTAIRDGVVVRVTFVDPPITQPWAGPTVLRIERRN